ncbi:MAG: DUF6198 family protein [Clostridia bacterium]|nr:DUF6198 family protein [Clostridia bacterium]
MDTIKKIKIKRIYRVLVYILGLFFIAMGVAFAINSDLGISAASSLPYITHLVTGIPFSITITVFYAFWVCVQWILIGKAFKWYNIFQVVFATIFGYFCDLCKLILGDFCFPTYIGKLGMLVIAILLIAVGIVLYAKVKLLFLPVEGMAYAFSLRYKKIIFPYFKLIADVFMVTVSIIISLIAFGKLVGIREGTVILAVSVGPVIKLISPPLEKLINKICFDVKV